MSVPSKLPKKYRYHWNHPWRRKAKYNLGFRRWLGKHGYLSPNFTLAEARCKDGTSVPRHLRPLARNHAFNLEKLRHKIGDRPIRIISWYRSPSYNARIGGARYSQHMRANATDHSREWVESVGRTRVMTAANQVWRKGGVGTYPAGSVHFDSRGWWARWTSWGR